MLYKNTQFKAYISSENSDGIFSRNLGTRTIDDLPSNDLLIRVHYSSLNYKDALSANGHKGITRNYPHTPGVDAAGVVVSSNSPDFKEGDEVVVTGHDLGMNTSGGFAEYISIPKEWAIKLPQGMTTKLSMMYGTGGITAGLCVDEIVNRGISPTDGPVLVTGATGAVGSIAVGIFAKLGYHVIVSTGKPEAKKMLELLGAKEFITREEVYDKTNKPLLPKRWKAAVDTVGGNTLSTVIRSTYHHGAVCVLGLVESANLNITVYPFLLRGVTLFGIDSAERGLNTKTKIWNKLADDWAVDNLSNIVREVKLDDIDPEIDKILDGKQLGKVLINCI